MEIKEGMWTRIANSLGDYLTDANPFGTNLRYSVRYRMEYTDGSVHFELVGLDAPYSENWHAVVVGPYSSTDDDAAKLFFEKCADFFGLSVQETLMKIMVRGTKDSLTDV